MLVDLYVEALLADEVLADQVWKLWNAGVITDEIAECAWCNLSVVIRQLEYRRGHQHKQSSDSAWPFDRNSRRLFCRAI